MKKSRCKIMCFFYIVQEILKKSALKVCFITYNNFKNCVCRYFKWKKPLGSKSKAAFFGIYWFYEQILYYSKTCLYKNAKGSNALLPIFVNLKSNTMKKSRCKIMCFFNTMQEFPRRNVLKACFITHIYYFQPLFKKYKVFLRVFFTLNRSSTYFLLLWVYLIGFKKDFM